MRDLRAGDRRAARLHLLVPKLLPPEQGRGRNDQSGFSIRKDALPADGGADMTRSTIVAALLMGAGSLSYSAPEITLREGVINPSHVCGSCHQQIYKMWERSMHAMAWIDPVFRLSYLKAYEATGGKARAICQPCHAPGADLSKGADRESLAAEGIGCDFCHSIDAVDLTKPGHALRITLDGVKRGPLPDAVSPAHEVAKSGLHTSAELCAGCHEYTNPEGVAILSTYTEWKASPQAAEGKTCQHCHMPTTPGQTVKPDLGIYRSEINLHDISGGHSADQVRKAASVRIVRVARESGRQAVIEVEVANVGSGHSLPTGLPTRRLVLEVVMFAGKQEVRRFERNYQKVLLDEHGGPIVDDYKVMLGARALREDTRLRPGERRLERFMAEAPSNGDLGAEAMLRYVYEPEITTRQAMSIDLGAARYP
jgi:cytochrome c554/c'-like protein